jgi:hypothetical protein
VVHYFFQHLNITNEKEIVEQIKNSANIYGLEKLTKNLFTSCQDHLIKTINSDLAKIKNKEVITKDHI